jgi:hypothetical protein
MAISSSRNRAGFPHGNPVRRQAQRRGGRALAWQRGRERRVSARKMSVQFFAVGRGARLQSSPTVVDIIMTTPLG